MSRRMSTFVLNRRVGIVDTKVALLLGAGLALASAGFGVGTARADVITVPTMDPAALQSALVDPANPSKLNVTSVSIRNGQPMQFGTYSNFNLNPVTIRAGVVLSSGSVQQLGPMPEVLDPLYEPSSPPAVVNSQMDNENDGSTSEFNSYGNSSNHIENFQGSYDVAALTVNFHLSSPSQVKFDFIFGSVEYPFYTSSFTDAFLVFLDGTNNNDQIAFDNAGNPVQVGASFAGLTVTNDLNTAFSSPHGLIHHLTTTTQMLSAGNHTLHFEVGDVNDHILDSAVFIANLRLGSGTPGTVPSDDDRRCSPADIAFDDGFPIDDVPGHVNNGINEGDYNCFFAADGFFEQASDGPGALGDFCDIACDDGEPLSASSSCNNSGVNEGDYNCFFNYFFLGCPN